MRPRSGACNREAKRMLLLVPVYPDEVAVGMLAKSTRRLVADVLHTVERLPSDFPLAERHEGRETYLTFPSIEDKRKAIGDAFVV